MNVEKLYHSGLVSNHWFHVTIVRTETKIRRCQGNGIHYFLKNVIKDS